MNEEVDEFTLTVEPGTSSGGNCGCNTEGTDTMSKRSELDCVDLPCAGGQILYSEQMANVASSSQILRTGSVLAADLINKYAAKGFGEVGLIEGRTASGIMATPIAPPTTGTT